MSDQRVIKLIATYDGTDFHGFQRQKDLRTVQGELERAVSRVAGHEVGVRGSSRTDAGVHARGLVVSFRTSAKHPIRAFDRGVNALLPEDVKIRSAEDAPDDFDARRASLGKTYRFLIWNDPSANPLLRRHAWHLRPRLDLDAIQGSLADLEGAHDFTSFRAAHCDAKSTDRMMWAARWTVSDSGALHCFEITGNAFLRNMVRIMVGSLVGIGLGRRPPGDLGRQLAALDRTQAGDTAPGHGLVLERVYLTASALYEALGREVEIFKPQLWPEP